MCGIAGVVGCQVDLELLRRMGTAIAHRGPDDAGEELFEDAGFSFRRLSIIDVAGGHQPIFNEDRSLAIILNGEIYNHHELRHQLENRGHRFRTRSDVETVLHLYEEKGEQCLQRLRGMYAFAIWDDRTKTLFLARDRVGKKPLYYARALSGGLIFGSEIKAILQHPEVPREPELAAIHQFLSLQYVPSPMTAFRGIDRVPPGHWLKWKDNTIEVKRYWRIDFSRKSRADGDELLSELTRLLRDAVRIRLESEVPLGVFLSGGVDSSAVVAFAAEVSPAPLKTFSIGFDIDEFDESAYARMVARQFGTDHHELTVTSDAAPELVEEMVWHYDQPFGDSSAVPSFHLARITKPHVTVILNGDGGDEIFGGYQRYRLNQIAPLFHLPRTLRHALFAAALPVARLAGKGGYLSQLRQQDAITAYTVAMGHLSPSQWPWLYSPVMVDQVRPSPPLETMREGHYPSFLDAMQDADVNHYLSDDLLVKMDVATMAYSLEARSPFLDHELMEFAATIPARYRLRRGESKYLLKKALRGRLPSAVLDRPKMGFGVPLSYWLRTSLRQMLEDTVLSDRALSRGYFRPEAVRAIVSAHKAGNDSYKHILWDLLMLELWHQQFIDRIPAAGPRSVPLSS